MSSNDDVLLQFTKADSDRLLMIEMKLDNALLGLASLDVIRSRIDSLERSKATLIGIAFVWAPICAGAGIAFEKYLLK